MPVSTHRVVRVLATAVVLFLATLMGAMTATAQVNIQAVGPASSAPAQTAAPAGAGGVAEEDSKPRQTPRRNGTQAQAPARDFGRVCDCDGCRAMGLRSGSPVTMREHVDRARDVDLALLHMTFRC
jgi:hypothetical protein